VIDSQQPKQAVPTLRSRRRGPCVFFCRSFIYKQRTYTLPRKDDSTDVLQYFLELSWRHCSQTTLKLICLLRSTNHFSKQSREDFYTAAIWLHRYHSETLAYNVGAFAKFGCLKDFGNSLPDCQWARSSTQPNYGEG
jgi:hypothetical protein